MKVMSNDRSTADYLPLAAYIVPQQIAERGDLWPYSTRAVEGRGGRVKKVRRKVVCFRKPAKEIWKAVRNAKQKSFSFKKSYYNSCSTLQTMRTISAQEESANNLHGRNRIATTGRHSLQRTLPKYQQEELPEMGKLLDPVALVSMLEKASAVFSDVAAVGFATAAEVEGASAHM